MKKPFLCCSFSVATSISPLFFILRGPLSLPSSSFFVVPSDHLHLSSRRVVLPALVLLRLRRGHHSVLHGAAARRRRRRHVHARHLAHHGRDPVREALGAVELVAARERGHVVHQARQALRVRAVRRRRHPFPQAQHHRVRGVQLEHGLVRAHAEHGLVHALCHGLGLHVPLHAGAHPVGGLRERGRRLRQLGAQLHALHLLLEQLAQPLHGGLEVLLGLLDLGLLLLAHVPQVHVLLPDVQQLQLAELVQVLQGQLVDGLAGVDDLVPLLAAALQRGGHLRNLPRVAGDVVDGLLALRHGLLVLAQRALLLARLGGEELHQGRDLGLVVVVLDHTDLDVFPVVLGEGLELGLVLLDGLEHVDGLAHEPLADDGQDLALLQDLAAHVQGQVLGVHHAAHEHQPPRQQLLELVADEHALDVELHGPRVLVEHVPRELKGQRRGHVQHALELHLALEAEVRVAQRVVVPAESALVELGVLAVGTVLGAAQPDRPLRVHPVPDVLRLGLRLHLGRLALGRRLRIRVRDLLVGGLLRPEVDGEVDELRVLLQQALDLHVVQVVLGVLLELQLDARAAAALELGAVHVLLHGEVVARAGRPLPLLAVAALEGLGRDRDLLRHQEGRVEPDAELPDEVHVRLALAQRLHEVPRA
mmetsp:Transcript_41548/g.64996  ORF Transcript_41548/g.64996 Transcript_41548/m.64996 type:complete len:648 (+) Transcript_41548:194-2137(+)